MTARSNSRNGHNTVTALPVLTDFLCAHPGCGAQRGFRCTYTGWSKGHPIRQQRVIETLDRRLALAKSPRLIAALTEHRATQLAAFGIAPVIALPTAPAVAAVAA
jgi:hypothetical protein